MVDSLNGGAKSFPFESFTQRMPFSSIRANTCLAAAAASSLAEFMAKSGFSGASYGAEIPVNSFIRPAFAFA